MRRGVERDRLLELLPAGGLGAQEIVRSALAGRLGLEVDFLKSAKDIAVAHHEKWDGSGYPHGLAGEAIPLAARLMALADVYDALISRRVYKAAMAHEEAMDIIVQSRDRHFDPRVVDAFLETHAEFRSISLKYSDE